MPWSAMLTYALKVKRLAARIAVVSMNVRRIRDIGLQSSLKATRRDGHLFVDVTCCRRPKRTAETVDFLSVTVFLYCADRYVDLCYLSTRWRGS